MHKSFVQISKQSVISGTIILIATTFGSNAIGIIREMIVAKTFGTSTMYDAYSVAFYFPGIIYAAFFYGMSNVYTPLYYKIRNSGTVEVLNRFVSDFIGMWSLFSVAICLLTIILTPVALTLVFDIPTEVLRHTITMTQLLMIGICLNCLFVIMRSLLNAEKHFIHPALATLLYNVLMIACIVIGSNYFSVYAMVYGSIAGMGSQLLYLLILFKKKNIDVKISFSLKDKNVRQSFRLAVPIMGLEALWGLYYFVDGYFASHLSTGSVSSLNYASTVFRFPGYLVGTSLGAALLPTFSEAVQQDQMIELKEKFSKAFRMLTILSMMFSGIFILTSRQIVSVLYQRGAFDALAVQRTSGTLQILSYGFIFVMMYPIVYRLFNALGHNKILMTSFLVGFVLKIGVYYGFLFRYGMQGIVLSMLVGFLAILGIPLFYLNRNVSLLSWTEVSVFFRSIGVLGACLLLNLILPSLLVLIVFTGVMIAINKNEFVIIVNQILSRFGIRTQNP